MTSTLPYMHRGQEVGLTPKISLILRARLQGRSTKQICDECHVTAPTLRNLEASPLYQERMKQLQATIDSKIVDRMAADPVLLKIKDAAERAADRNIELMESEDPRVAQGSVWDILDRSGYVKKQRSEVEQSVRVFLPPESARALAEVLQESNVVPPEPPPEEPPI
jgi:hypothetical protein